MTLGRLLAVIAATVAVLCPVAGSAADGPSISAPDAVVLDGWTGDVLYAKNQNASHDPASTVKIMTALVVLEKHIPLNRPVTVGWEAATFPGSSAGLYTGERLTVRTLLYGMLLPSGNDAAMALAEATAGTPARFVEIMNREAKRLHLWHTRYATPNGFDARGQVTTAADLADLARVAMQRSTFLSVVRTREWTTWDLDRRVFHRWKNLNKLLWMSHAVDGIKTGTTPGAGACLVSSARRDDKWVIEVNLGSRSDTRFSDGAALLDYGFRLASRLPTTD